MRRLVLAALLAGAAFGLAPAHAVTCGATVGDCVENTCNRLGCPVERCHHWIDQETCLY